MKILLKNRTVHKMVKHKLKILRHFTILRILGIIGLNLRESNSDEPILAQYSISMPLENWCFPGV